MFELIPHILKMNYCNLLMSLHFELLCTSIAINTASTTLRMLQSTKKYSCYNQQKNIQQCENREAKNVKSYEDIS